MNKKLLSIIALILVLCFALVSCGDNGDTTTPSGNDHTHTFETGDAWAYDATMHWHAALCSHKTEKADIQGHVDADINGECDVCGYNADHEHSFKEAWSFDAEKHWHDSDCYHKVFSDEAAHTPDNMGICTVCGYIVSDPDVDSVKDAITVGSTQSPFIENGLVEMGNGYYELVPAVVGRGTITVTEGDYTYWWIGGEYEVVVYENGNVILEGDYVMSEFYLEGDAYAFNCSSSSYFDDVQYYGLTLVNEDGEALTGLEGTAYLANAEGTVFTTFEFDIEEVDEPEHYELVEEVSDMAAYEFRDGYLYVVTMDGTEYYYTATEDGVFAVMSYYDMLDTFDYVTELLPLATVDNLKGYQFSTNFIGNPDGIAFYGAEDLVATLYSMASVDNLNGDFVESLEDGVYSFSFGYFNTSAAEEDGTLYVISVEFTLDEESYAIKTVELTSEVYYYEQLEKVHEATDEAPATFKVLENELPASLYTISIEQNVEVENPYQPETLLMKDFDLVDSEGNLIEDTITIEKGYTSSIGFLNVIPDTAMFAFNTIEFAGDNVIPGGLEGLNPYYYIGDDFFTLRTDEEAGTTFELELIVNGNSKFYTVNVVEPVPTEILAGSLEDHYNEWNQATGNYVLSETDYVTVSEGTSKIIAAHLDKNVGEITITVDVDGVLVDGDFVNQAVVGADGVSFVPTTGYNLRGLPVGTYTFTFTSDYDESFVKTIDVEITEAVVDPDAPVADATPNSGAGIFDDPYMISANGTYLAEVPADGTLYYIFTAPEAGEYTFSYYGDFYVWMGTYGNFNLLTDGANPEHTDNISYTLEAGNTVYFTVSSYFDPSAAQDIFVTVSTFGQGGDEGGNVVEEGTFVLDDSDAGPGLAGTYEYVLYDDNTVELTLGGAPVTAFSLVYNGSTWSVESLYPGIMNYLGFDRTLVDENRNPITAFEGTAYIYQMGPAGYVLLSIEFGATEGGEGGGEGNESGTGAEDDPYLITIPTDVTINSNTEHKEYFAFTATESGYVTITYPNADSYCDYYLFNDGYADGSVTDSTYLTETFTFYVEAGNDYRLGLSTWNTSGACTITIEFEAGEPPVDETPDPSYVDLALGDNALPGVIYNYICIPTYATFTATEDGLYTLSAAADEWNADVCDANEFYLNLPYTFILHAGESVTFTVMLNDYNLTEDTLDLVLTRDGDIPAPVTDYDLLDSESQVVADIEIEAGMNYYFTFQFNAPTEVDMSLVTILIDGENLNAEFDMSNMTAYNNCLVVEYDSYSGALLVKTRKAVAGTSFSFTLTLDEAVKTYNVTVVPACPTNIYAGQATEMWGSFELEEKDSIEITAGNSAFLGAYANRFTADDVVVTLNGAPVDASALIINEFWDNDIGGYCPSVIYDLSTLAEGTYTFVFTSNSNAALSATVNVTVNAATSGGEGGEGGETTGGVTGTYLGTDGFGNQSLTLVVDDTTVTFNYTHPYTGSTSIVANYEIADGAMTLYDPATGDEIPLLAASVTLVGGIPAYASYNGTDYTLVKEGGSAEVDVTGTYLGTDTFGNQTLTIVIDETTVTFNYTHPYTGPSSLVANYEIADGAMTLYDPATGDEIPLLAGSVTLVGGIPTYASYNGTDYTLVEES